MDNKQIIKATKELLKANNQYRRFLKMTIVELQKKGGTK